MAKKIYSETATINYIEYVQDTIVLDYLYTDALGNAIDMTAYDVVAEVRRNQTDATALLTYSSLQNTITLNESANANISLVITDAQTASLSAGIAYYFIKLTKKSNNFVNTLVVGTIKLAVR